MTIGDVAKSFLKQQLDWVIDVIVPMPPSDTSREYGNQLNLRSDDAISKSLMLAKRLAM